MQQEALSYEALLKGTSLAFSYYCSMRSQGLQLLLQHEALSYETLLKGHVVIAWLKEKGGEKKKDLKLLMHEAFSYYCSRRP